MVRANDKLCVLSAEAPINQSMMTDGSAFYQLQEEIRARLRRHGDRSAAQHDGPVSAPARRRPRRRRGRRVHARRHARRDPHPLLAEGQCAAGPGDRRRQPGPGRRPGGQPQGFRAFDRAQGRHRRCRSTRRRPRRPPSSASRSPRSPSRRSCRSRSTQLLSLTVDQAATKATTKAGASAAAARCSASSATSSRSSRRSRRRRPPGGLTAGRRSRDETREAKCRRLTMILLVAGLVGALLLLVAAFSGPSAGKLVSAPARRRCASGTAARRKSPPRRRCSAIFAQRAEQGRQLRQALHPQPGPAPAAAEPDRQELDAGAICAGLGRPRRRHDRRCSCSRALPLLLAHRRRPADRRRPAAFRGQQADQAPGQQVHRAASPTRSS